MGDFTANLVFKYLMGYLGKPDVDAIKSTLSENCTAHFINDGCAETYLDIDSNEFPVIRSRQQIIDYFRYLHFHELINTTIDKINYLPNDKGAIVQVQSRQTRDIFSSLIVKETIPYNIVIDTITFIIKDGKITYVEHDFSIVRSGWTQEEIDHAHSLYEEQCKAYGLP